MQFVFQPLAWGFLLVIVPLLIHLINLVRHRRTQWAAMDFLLESYRKHRRWVWLKQALLIASRMLAIALVVAMLAQWVSGSKWLSALGQSTTHHYVIIDDSASMADVANGKSAYQAALSAIQSIANSANQGNGSHLLSIIRTSRASHAVAATNGSKNSPAGDEEPNNAASQTSGLPNADAVADILARTIPTDPSALLTKINATQPTYIDCGFLESLDLLAPLLQQSSSEKAIVYLMSDFRSKDWNNAAVVKERLLTMPGEDVEYQLIDCVAARHENLTLVSIQPQQEVLAAGVPSLINVSVRNNGTAPVRNVAIRVSAVDYSAKDIEIKASQRFSGLVTELPPLLIDRLEPGELATKQVQVLFPRSGSHVVEAQLPPDSLSSDNTSRCVLDLREGLRVLLIDGDAGRKHSFFFESALNPGGNAKTGLIMSSEGPEFLRDSDPSSLQNYACIIIQSLSSLDQRGLENLHRYISSGGGAALFFGESLTTADYLRGYEAWTKPIAGAENTTPLLPFGLKGTADLKREPEDTTPDFAADNHPIFAPLIGLSNSPFQFVRIQKYVEIENASSPELSKSLKSVATLRNGHPLIVDHPIGDGRMLIALTALDRKWTNWPQDPTFVVAALKTVGYLSSFRTPETSRIAGTPMRWDYSSQEMLPETQIVCPTAPGSSIRPILNINAVPAGETMLQASMATMSSQDNDETIRASNAAGDFEWWGTSIQGDRIVKNIARNTPALEGELEKIAAPDLNRSLSGVKFAYRSTEALAANASISSFVNRNMLLMAMLLLLLLFEQWLAWSASYHLPKS